MLQTSMSFKDNYYVFYFVSLITTILWKLCVDKWISGGFVYLNVYVGRDY